MNETLGKRIAAHRKALNLTQDQLAEQIGVTAQAVSKWENDQSCPDISVLPKLAEIFHTTTDSLLGVEPQPVHKAQVVTDGKADAEGNDHRPKFEFQFGDDQKGGNFELTFDGGRRGILGVAAWLLLTAGGMVLAPILGVNTSTPLWDMLWPSGLLVFGLFGLYPKFSMFRLGCALFGGYSLLDTLLLAPRLNRELVLPLFLLLFGLWLLLEGLKPKKLRVSGIPRHQVSNRQEIDGEQFYYAASFGEQKCFPVMSRLSGGNAQVSFGEMTLDLRGCEEIAPDCAITLQCSFGELEVLIPRGCRADITCNKSFGNLEMKGNPAPGAQRVLQLDCHVSFGQIEIIYL